MQSHKFKPQPFGKYLLTERIGAGGMAEIFRATAFGVEGFTKEICIKRILPTLTVDETFIKMFISEAKLAVNLHHANVVQVFDLGRIGEHYFIAMELVRGRDLLQIINRCRALRKRVPIPIALYILSQVCKGLDYAHRVKVEGRPAGIIHRDVSLEYPGFLGRRRQGRRLRHRQGFAQGRENRYRHIEGQVRLHVPRAGTG